MSIDSIYSKSGRPSVVRIHSWNNSLAGIYKLPMGVNQRTEKRGRLSSFNPVGSLCHPKPRATTCPLEI